MILLFKWFHSPPKPFSHCLWHYSSFVHSHVEICAGLTWLELAGFVEYITRINRGNLALNGIIPWVPLMGNPQTVILWKANWRLSSCVWLVFSKKKTIFPTYYSNGEFSGWDFHFSKTFHLFYLKWVFKFKNWNGNVNECPSFDSTSITKHEILLLSLFFHSGIF